MDATNSEKSAPVLPEGKTRPRGQVQLFRLRLSIEPSWMKKVNVRVNSCSVSHGTLFDQGGPVEAEKFQFPSKGFYIVARKVGEADYFLEMLKSTLAYYDEFAYVLSAFTSAARSITFSLQAVMSKYPGFEDWYEMEQEKLRANDLAKYFVNLRNYLQKVGESPVEHSGMMSNGKIRHFSYFVDIEGLEKAPSGEVTKLAEEYFVDILKLVERCYRHFWVYVDPRAIFTEKGLALLGWTIEDLEEGAGLPRGYTDIPYDGNDKNFQRLRLLYREFGGDELMEQYFSKYNISTSGNPC